CARSGYYGSPYYAMDYW
nr:immunoglobulin heavy chain junction region [Mus musculus]NSM05815.1 immunoglobulin heavy chain junction region [Mus musculus]NSM08780.1 immunoglobulin heavy chain junction region [Mus musculus]NSM09608.1 immunoglobulin heavy chain junction region [Mus musculus]